MAVRLPGHRCHNNGNYGDGDAAANAMAVVDDAPPPGLGGERGDALQTSTLTSTPPPLVDVEGLAAKLDCIPRWHFQEQVSLAMAPPVLVCQG